MSDHRFLDLPSLVEPGDLVVVNNTKVRAARLAGRRRETGGQIELLVLGRRPDGSWEALARPARRLRPGILIDFEELTATIAAVLDKGRVTVWIDSDDPEAELARSGTVPLPPYFTGELENPDRYQTIFATTPGSAAAPTAGLHFTDEVVRRLEARGIQMASVDLHVSLDTFRPMSVESVEDHDMHSEWCVVTEETAGAIEAVRQRRGRVVAIGTTVVRTLESRADGVGGVTPGDHRTDLFLKPGSEFTVVDVLVTNFHLPGSTLLVLLAGFMGEKWREAYATALDRGYRFLSFGDAMLAARHTT